MRKIIIEVGSTCTKVDCYDGEAVSHLATVTILFKKHYKEEGHLLPADVSILIQKVQQYAQEATSVYVCGTSIFRSLSQEEKDHFLQQFQQETGYPFHILSDLQENEYTVFGATRHVTGKVAVVVAGGGSTEIAVYDKTIQEMVNTPMGVIDILQEYPDLGEDIATTPLDTVVSYVKDKLQVPTEKVDTIILAGGAHLYFAKESGITYEENTLYVDELQPIMMDLQRRKADTKRYFEEISMDAIRKRVEDPDWWYATRGMCALVLAIAEKMEARYIVPTDISMVYGLLEQ